MKKKNKVPVAKQVVTVETAFQLPLKNYHGKVFTADDHMAFDFAQKFSYPTAFTISEDNRNKITAIVNGEQLRIDTNLDLSMSDGTIYVTADGVKKEFIIIRGWGHLCGFGALNLDEETAAKIQDEFAAMVFERIKNAIDRQ